MHRSPRCILTHTHTHICHPHQRARDRGGSHRASAAMVCLVSASPESGAVGREDVLRLAGKVVLTQTSTEMLMRAWNTTGLIGLTHKEKIPCVCVSFGRNAAVHVNKSQWGKNV